METIDSRISKVQKQAQTGGDKQAKLAFEVLSKYKTALEKGENARSVSFDSKDEQRAAHDLFLLTNKPILYVCNVDEASAVKGNKYVDAVREAIKGEEAELLVIAAKIESEIAEFETYEERQMFLSEIGLEESGVNRLIKSAYKLLNLQTFLTAGPDECRAWTFHKGWKAPQCAGVVHTDFEKGFIRAEVIKYDDYISYGSENAVKEAGKMNVEGKDYVVQDGDIMNYDNTDPVAAGGSYFLYRQTPMMAVYDESDGGYGKDPAGGYYSGVNQLQAIKTNHGYGRNRSRKDSAHNQRTCRFRQLLEQCYQRSSQNTAGSDVDFNAREMHIRIECISNKLPKRTDRFSYVWYSNGSKETGQISGSFASSGCRNPSI